MDEDLVHRVMYRDLRELWRRTGNQGPPSGPFLRTNSPCVAAFLDPLGSVICGGRITMEHVTPGYGRMGRKAADREEELVSLCESHHLWSWGGHVWALAHKGLTRQYLEEMYRGY